MRKKKKKFNLAVAWLAAVLSSLELAGHARLRNCGSAIPDHSPGRRGLHSKTSPPAHHLASLLLSPIPPAPPTRGDGDPYTQHLSPTTDTNIGLRHAGGQAGPGADRQSTRQGEGRGRRGPGWEGRQGEGGRAGGGEGFV